MPVASEPGSFVWSEVELESACEQPPEPEGTASPVNMITTEADFERAYCRSSEVDWSRFRLARVHFLDHLFDLTVVRDESYVRVFLRTRPTCEAQWGSQLHLLLPAEDAPVIVVRKTAPPAECPDGYSY